MQVWQLHMHSSKNNYREVQSRYSSPLRMRICWTNKILRYDVKDYIKKDYIGVQNFFATFETLPIFECEVFYPAVFCKEQM